MPAAVATALACAATGAAARDLNETDLAQIISAIETNQAKTVGYVQVVLAIVSVALLVTLWMFRSGILRPRRIEEGVEGGPSHTLHK